MTTTTEIAKSDIDAAHAHAQAIEERLLAGDPSVSAADLVSAREETQRLRGVFATSVELSRKRADIGAELARQERIAALDAFVRAHFGSHEGHIIEAFDAVVDALVPFIEGITAHNDALAEVCDELRSLNVPPSGWAMTGEGNQVRISDLDVTLRPHDPQILAAEAVVRALRRCGQPVAKLEPMAEVRPAYDDAIIERYGVARGELVGNSTILRDIARTVAERP